MLPFAPLSPQTDRVRILFLVSICFAVIGTTGSAHAQAKENVLYTFCQQPNCADGATPEGNTVVDQQGNIYGSTYAGGVCGAGYGTVFELFRQPDGTYLESVLHSFGASTGCQNPADGAGPSGLILDAKGNLYGVTSGQGPNGRGTVFELSPPTKPGTDWTETILWGFAGPDGSWPQGKLSFDQAGNLYDTTTFGGIFGQGTVFQLVPPVSGTQWTLNTLYNFGGNDLDGSQPYAGVVFDNSGNLYGTTQFGGKGIGYHKYGWGIVYKLTPSAQLPWTESILYWFTPKTGVNPISELAIDSTGKLYGTLLDGGPAGAIFRLVPVGGGAYHFDHLMLPGAPNASGPGSVLFVNGALYGASVSGGVSNAGSIFQVKGTHESVVYSFCSQPNCADGGSPWRSGLTLHGGSLFGTVTQPSWGGVFQLSPP